MRNILSLIILFSIVAISCSSRYDAEFDSENWKTWNESESTMTLRWDMRKDLIKKHKLIGLTVPEVIELLGEPENKSDSEFRYYLGMARFGIDTGSLSLLIENGKVINYKIWHG